MKEFFETVLNKNITFYEIDKSSIISNFAFYIEKNLYLNIKSIKDDYIENKSYDNSIVEKIKLIINCLDYNEQKIINFLKILNFCIISMNCFKVNIQDGNNMTMINSFSIQNGKLIFKNNYFFYIKLYQNKLKFFK